MDLRDAQPRHQREKPLRVTHPPRRNRPSGMALGKLNQIARSTVFSCGDLGYRFAEAGGYGHGGQPFLPTEPYAGSRAKEAPDILLGLLV